MADEKVTLELTREQLRLLRNAVENAKYAEYPAPSQQQVADLDALSVIIAEKLAK